MNKPQPQSAERGVDSLQRPGSAIVYSGPHYGRTHKIIKRTETLTWVEYHGDRFAVPHCDVEELDQSPKSGLGAAGAQLQGRGRDTASQQTLSPNISSTK
jgi:hypothetical protein